MTLAQSSFRKKLDGIQSRCTCSLLEGTGRCQEHGRRCACCDKLTAESIMAWTHQSVQGALTYFCGQECLCAYHEKVGLNPAPEALGIAIKKQAAPVKFDPYEFRRTSLDEAAIAKATYDHPANVRARKVAALREELSKPVERRYPHEGRSDRVYAENRR